jgi:hypothetical protein
MLREIDVPSDRDKNDNDVWEPFLGLTYWFNVRWGVELDGTYSNRSYENDDDREQYDSTYRLRRRFTRHLDGFVEYRNTVLDFDGNRSDYVVHAPAAGIDYQLDENTSISLGGGYYIQDRDNDSNESGYFTDASILKRWPYRRGFVTLTGASGYDIDDEGEEDLGLNIYYRTTLAAGYDFTRRLSGNASISGQYNDYPDENRDDQTINAGTGLNYLATRWMRLGLSYDFTKQFSDDSNDEYTVNRVLFTVNLFPTQPFRINR